MTKSKLARDIIKEFQGHSKRGLASLLMKRHPKLFDDWENARETLKNVTNPSRKQSRHKQVSHAYAPAPPLPESKSKPWEPFEVSGCERVLVLSDIHVPYHDGSALETALAHGDKYEPDCILLNGDVVDFYTISRFDTNPEQRDLPGEIQACRELLAHLRGRFPKARIIYKLGNHDERWWHYLWRKAPELVGCSFLNFPQVMEAEKRGVEVVDDARKIMLGRLNVLHGHEWRLGANSPVSPARTAFLKGIACSLSGHLHKTSEDSNTSLDDSLITCWSTGCLCELHPAYARINKWNWGFATVDLSGDGQFNVKNLRIRHGRVL